MASRFLFFNIIATNWYMNTFEKDGITSQLGNELLSSLGLDKSLISKAASCTRTLSFFSVMVRKQSNPDISRTSSCFHLNHLSWHGRGAPRQWTCQEAVTGYKSVHSGYGFIHVELRGINNVFHRDTKWLGLLRVMHTVIHAWSL